MRWFKRSSADTPHLKSLSPLKNNELQQGSMHPAVSSSSTIAATAATFKSGEVGARNEFLSVSMLSATVGGIEEEQQQRHRRHQYVDAVKCSDSDRNSHSKENRRDWRRSYNRNTVNCYNIQEGKIVNTAKIRDRSLSPSFLRRKRSDVIDVRKIFEATKTKESNESYVKDSNLNTVRTRCKNNLMKERRNPLTTTRLSFCESKLAFDDGSNYSIYDDSTTQQYNVDKISSRINDTLTISTSNKNRYSVKQLFNNDSFIKAKDSESSFLGNKSKSVEDFSKDEMLSLNRLTKTENKFKTLSGKTQKFLSNFYKNRFDKNALTTKQPSTQNLHNQEVQYHQSKNHNYETHSKIITDCQPSEDTLSNEWCPPTDYRLSESCYSTLIDSQIMTTDADSGILENDSGQSSLNSIPVAENAPALMSLDGSIRFNDATAMPNQSSNGESGTFSNKDCLVTILCDDSFKDFSKHLYHSKGSYFITNIIVKKTRLIDGFILAGDEILDICGIPIRGKPYIEVYNLLQNIQLNSQNNYVRMLLRRISENGIGGSASITNAYQKGVLNSRRNGICLLRDVDKSPDKSLDFAANVIRIDGSRKPTTETPNSQRKFIDSMSSNKNNTSLHFQKNISAYGSITRRLIRRSLLGKLTSSSVMDVSQLEASVAANEDNNSSTTSNNSDNDSNNTEIDQQSNAPSNFFTLPRKSKIGVYSFHTICYEKGPGKKSLGFTIVGGRDSPKGAIGIFVKRILNTGQAIEDGRLRVGDEILSVNGQVCHDLSHEEAVKLFKSVRCGELVLRVCRRERQSSGAKNGNNNCNNENHYQNNNG